VAFNSPTEQICGCVLSSMARSVEPEWLAARMYTRLCRDVERGVEGDVTIATRERAKQLARCPSSIPARWRHEA
jgi:hypothetical protein